MSIDDIIPSTLKVIANENLDIQKDLQTPDPEPQKLEALLNETKEEEKDQEES